MRSCNQCIRGKCQLSACPLVPEDSAVLKELMQLPIDEETRLIVAGLDTETQKLWLEAWKAASTVVTKQWGKEKK